MTRKQLLRLSDAQWEAAEDLRCALRKCSELGVELIVFPGRYNNGLIRAFSSQFLDDFSETMPPCEEGLNFAAENDMEIIGDIMIAEDEHNIEVFWNEKHLPTN